MYASYIEVQFKPGKTAEAMEMARQMKSELGQMGMKQFIVADKGDDSSTLLALYDTAEDQEAAGPKAAELLGRLADLFAVPPERKQVEVPINFSF
jgi:hypothetical protein